MIEQPRRLLTPDAIGFQDLADRYAEAEAAPVTASVEAFCRQSLARPVPSDALEARLA